MNEINKYNRYFLEINERYIRVLTLIYISWLRPCTMRKSKYQILLSFFFSSGDLQVYFHHFRIKESNLQYTPEYDLRYEK